MPGTAKIEGSNRTCTFLFSNVSYSVSNKIVGQLFLCLSVVGLVHKSWNPFFLLRAFF